jgi:predicted ester cyclase
MTENKALVEAYLRSLSGHPKTPEMIATYVADRKLIEHITECERAFPAYELVIEDLIGEGDRVVVRGEFRGIHVGQFLGIEPSGKPVSAGLIIIYQIAGGKIVDHWMQFDLFTLMGQLRQNQPEADRANLVSA